MVKEPNRYLPEESIGATPCLGADKGRKEKSTVYRKNSREGKRNLSKKRMSFKAGKKMHK